MATEIGIATDPALCLFTILQLESLFFAATLENWVMSKS
jgi:hypothetical protein